MEKQKTFVFLSLSRNVNFVMTEIYDFCGLFQGSFHSFVINTHALHALWFFKGLIFLDDKLSTYI